MPPFIVLLRPPLFFFRSFLSRKAKKGPLMQSSVEIASHKTGEEGKASLLPFPKARISRGVKKEKDEQKREDRWWKTSEEEAAEHAEKTSGEKFFFPSAVLWFVSRGAAQSHLATRANPLRFSLSLNPPPTPMQIMRRRKGIRKEGRVSFPDLGGPFFPGTFGG